MDSLIKKYYFSCTPDYNYLNTSYCGSFIAPANYCHGPINSDKYILNYIKKGKGTFNFSDKTYSLEEGCSFIVFPGHIFSHTADGEDPWSYCWFEISGNILENFLRLSDLTIDNPIHVHKNYGLINQITDDILNKYYINSVQCELYRIGLLHRFFTECLNDLSEPRIEAPLLEHVQSNKYIKKAISFISENYAKDVTINTIANYVGLDRSYFSRLFKEVTGSNPSDYVMNYQMSKARFLFMHTNYKIEEIAHLVGYKSLYQFTKMFKSTALMTPSEYKKNASK